MTQQLLGILLMATGISIHLGVIVFVAARWRGQRMRRRVVVRRMPLLRDAQKRLEG